MLCRMTSKRYHNRFVQQSVPVSAATTTAAAYPVLVGCARISPRHRQLALRSQPPPPSSRWTSLTSCIYTDCSRAPFRGRLRTSSLGFQHLRDDQRTSGAEQIQQSVAVRTTTVTTVVSSKVVVFTFVLCRLVSLWLQIV